MSIPASKPIANHRPPTWVILVTVAWLALIAGAAWWKWDSLCQMGLNELGDFAAGAAAPLAFFWLIAGYFQQGTELRQNTEALRLQAEELARSVEQQKALARTTKESLDLSTKVAREQARYMRESQQPVIVASAAIETFSGYESRYSKWVLRLTNYGHVRTQHGGAGNGR